MQHPNQEIMQRAINLALAGFKNGGQTVGAVVVKGDEVIAEAYTTVKRDEDSTCHAEMNAMRLAMKKLGQHRLLDCYIYTTYEPCPMCASAAVWARAKGIIYGASHEDQTADWQYRVKFTAQEILDRGEPKLELYPEFMRAECQPLLELKTEN